MVLRFLIIAGGLALAASTSWAATCSINDLVAKIKILDPRLQGAKEDFGGADPYYRRPALLGDPIQVPYKDDLTAAFNLAVGPADKLLEALCKLDYIFIDTTLDLPNAPLGWGFWEGPDQSPGNFQAIGLSISLWLDPRFQQLTSTETFLAQSSLLNNLPEFEYSAVDDETKNNRTWVLLSVLAHEMGHISYRGGERDINNSCYHGWTNRSRTSVRFKKITDIQDESAYRRFQDIRDLVADGDYTEARRWIGDDIYRRGNFASLFAVESAEEDFSETIKLAVLSKAGLGKLVVKIEGVEMNVMAPLNDRAKGLYEKAWGFGGTRCFWDYLVPP